MFTLSAYGTSPKGGGKTKGRHLPKWGGKGERTKQACFHFLSFLLLFKTSPDVRRYTPSGGDVGRFVFMGQPQGLPLHEGERRRFDEGIEPYKGGLGGPPLHERE